MGKLTTDEKSKQLANRFLYDIANLFYRAYMIIKLKVLVKKMLKLETTQASNSTGTLGGNIDGTPNPEAYLHYKKLGKHLKRKNKYGKKD